MKKHLLLGTALVAAISAFPQAAVHGPGKNQLKNMSVEMAKKFASLNRVDREQAPVSNEVIPSTEAPIANLRTSNTSSIGAVNWNNFTGSANMYGYLVSGERPLAYDDELNAVTFVHRKSSTYVATPNPTSVGATTGVLVAMVSQNWGTSWDSTMIYNDQNLWARYPQGGILKGNNATSPTNTNIANAYIVATAPITSADPNVTWIGDIITKKALGPGTYNNVQSLASQTFVANTPPYTWQGGSMKVDFLRDGFSSSDDGTVRMLGSIDDGGTGTAFRGGRLITGTFNSGSLIFTSDSIIPMCRPNNLDGGRLLAYPQGMAWSEDGKTGYIWFIGAHTSVVGNNVGPNSGFQPIIARTNDFGLTWSQQSIDFAQPSYSATVLKRLYNTDANLSLSVPYFAFWEGIGAVVDSARNLHLVATLIHSPAANDPDSVAYTVRFPNYDGENYYSPHLPGLRPYVYDFHGGTTGAYQVTLIDSLATEQPGDAAADDGYGLNPWSADPSQSNAKITIDDRIQASRSIDGRYIVYSWAETDTINTTNSNGFTKWNYFPNIKARMFDTRTNCLSPTEINVSKLPDANNQTKMTKTSYNHYISSKCAEDLSASSTNSVVLKVPHTISFNSGLNPATAVITRYATVPLEFARCVGSSPTNTLVTDTTTHVGFAAHNFNSASTSYIFPNPASNSAYLSINMKSNSNVKISVLNIVGQVVKTVDAKTQIGTNNINIDLNGLSKGIYMVNVNVDNAVGTKKLLIE